MVAGVAEVLNSWDSDESGADEGIQCLSGSVGNVSSKSYSDARSLLTHPLLVG